MTPISTIWLSFGPLDGRVSGPRFRRLRKVSFGALLTVLGAATQAGTVALGEIAEPLSWPLNQRFPVLPLADRYTFSIASGTTWTFSAFMSTGYNKYTQIPDLKGELFRDGAGLLTEDAQWMIHPTSGFYLSQVSFDPFELGAGNYELRFSGNVISAYGVPGQYTGQMAFQPPASIPEPSTLALAGLALMALLACGVSKGA
jgi:hypothetical protein